MGGIPEPISRAFLRALSRAWSVFGSRLYGIISGFVGVEFKKKNNQLQTKEIYLLYNSKGRKDEKYDYRVLLLVRRTL